MGTPSRSILMMSLFEKKNRVFLPDGGMFVMTRSLVGGREQSQIKGENNDKYTKKELETDL